MAGAGVKLFTAGSQLTATEVNTYLMDQVVAYFADSAARDAAFGGAGEPSLSAGRLAYLFSDNKLYLYDNTNNWVEIGAQVEDGEITTAKIASLAVTTAKLADDAVTSAKIADGTIVNADINSSAAIAHSKLANATAGQVLLGTTTTGVVTATTVSGDVTITGAGVTAIGAGVIVNADINASAAIDKTKISGTAITAGDTGTVTSTMIADGTIVNADINASAAIDLGKLADATIDEKSSSYTLALTDKNKFIKMNVTSTANTVTVPTNASVAFPVGSQIHIIQYGTGKTQVIPVSGTVTIYATPGTYLRAQYSSATLLKCDTNIWMLMGDLSAS